MDIEFAKQLLEAAAHSVSHDMRLTNVVLEGLPRFDMSSWVDSPELIDTWVNDADDARIPLRTIREGSCGTSACLAGYATLLRAPADWTTNGSRLFDGDGNAVSNFETFACEQLDVDADVADALFYASDNELALDRLRYLVDHPDVSGQDIRDAYPNP